MVRSFVWAQEEAEEEDKKYLSSITSKAPTNVTAMYRNRRLV
ncbi:hypothetical protein RDI58_003378 [Solanum bulbocastanum]|uniref:Uncharacterized protein n=1 Tax=Solanum bulbocastanum TaxID=147425 RepID=A0AAN8UD35_SOLBU